jgi:hypothetical protein
MKIYTKVLKAYPGDKTIQIRAMVKQGTTCLMNITPFWCSSDKCRMYSNDINGLFFSTITKAKEYCRNNINSLITIPAN